MNPLFICSRNLRSRDNPVWVAAGLLEQSRFNAYVRESGSTPGHVTTQLAKCRKWKPRKPADMIPYTPEESHAETRAAEYAIAAEIPFTTRPDGAFVFLDLRGLICFRRCGNGTLPFVKIW